MTELNYNEIYSEYGVNLTGLDPSAEIVIFEIENHGEIFSSLSSYAKERLPNHSLIAMFCTKKCGELLDVFGENKTGLN